jgi:glucans biosynthesis protein C
LTTLSLPAASAPSALPLAAAKAADRIHYLDNVRAIAMLLGLVFHGGFTYAFPSQSIWIVADFEGSTVIDALIWFLHIFRMATFFLIAGYFGKLLVERRGTRGFLWNRFLRIACPFVLFFPFLLVGYGVAMDTAYRANNSQLPPLMAQGKEINAKQRAKAEEEIKADPAKGLAMLAQVLNNTMHMWFLYYLGMFSVVAAIFANFKLVAVDRFFDWLYGSFWPTLFAPLLLAPALYVSGSPTGQTESFIPKLWVFGYYGLLFLAGWKLWGREAYIDKANRYVWLLIPVCAAMYAAYYYYMPNMMEIRELVLVQGKSPDQLPKDPLPIQVGMAMLSAYLTVFLMLISLCLGKRFLSGHSQSLRFVSDASYWIYLVHLPLIIFIQGLMVTLHWSIWIKFPLSVVLTFVISLLSYAVFVRYTPLGWLLNGYKPFPWAIFGGAKAGVAQAKA